MQNELGLQVSYLNKAKRCNKVLYRIFFVVASLVVFFTTYVLIIPAITYERGDSTADLESISDWTSSVCSVELSGNYSKDLIEIAKTQIGYSESQKNFILGEDAKKHHYSRYGVWYGDEYADWGTIFAAFCLRYANVENYELYDNSFTWVQNLSATDGSGFFEPQLYYPEPGNLVFFEPDDEFINGNTGIVENVSDDGFMTVIMRDKTGTVSEITVSVDEKTILGYAQLPVNPDELINLTAKTQSGTQVELSATAREFDITDDEIQLIVDEVLPISDDENKADPDEVYDLLRSVDPEEAEKAIAYDTKLLNVEIVQNEKRIRPRSSINIAITDEQLARDDTFICVVDEEGNVGKVDAEEINKENNEANITVEDVSKLIIATPVRSKVAARGAYNAPGTVQTVDNKEDGIVLNLFDYYGYNLDVSENTVLSPVYNGINAVNSTYGQDYLLFFGTGENYNNVYPTNGQNCFTGEGTAMQGIVKNTLRNGYPVLARNNSSLSYLFDTSPLSDASVKKIYPDVNHLFQKDSDGYYWYDSDKNYAYYNKNTGNFIVYNGTYYNSYGSKIGFFPFNDYDTRYTDVKPSDSTHHYNHHFGMTMNASFTIPKGSKVNGKNMVFDFSGDDDMWVFIDDVLVLDIGGLHEKVSGSINFTTGAVSVSAVRAVSGFEYGGTIGGSSTISQIFARAGKTYDSSEGSEHKISFFYMERGGCFSNCSLRFNLCLYQKRDLTIEKNVVGENTSPYADNQFQFQLYLEKSVESNQYTVYPGPAVYNNGTAVAFDQNGTFTLKPGQKITVPDIVDLKKYYLKEVNVDGNDFAWFKVNGEYVQATQMPDNSQLLQVICSPYSVKEHVEVIFDNILKEGKVNIAVEKVWSDGNQNHTNDSISFTLLRNGTAYSYNGHTTHTLNSDNNWRTEFYDMVMEGNGQTYQYTVSEIETEGYTVTYHSEMRQGVYTITINNEKLPEPPKITVLKKWYSFSGKEIDVSGVQGIDIELWRKYYVPGTPPQPQGHTVSFAVDVNNGSSITRTVLKTVEAAHGTDVSFIAPIWYGAHPTGAYLNGNKLPTDGMYNDMGSTPIYVLRNVIDDVTVLLKYDVASNDGWIWSGNVDNLKSNLSIIDHTEPSQQSSAPTEGEWVDELVETVTLNRDGEWRHSWGESDVPAQTSQGYDCSYYVKENTVEDYYVVYVNNDGIQQGIITVKNTCAIEAVLPQTGGTGTLTYTLGGLLLIITAGAIMYGYILRQKNGRRYE